MRFVKIDSAIFPFFRYDALKKVFGYAILVITYL